ncbi:hypothetical protein HQQ94_04855 [Shewanella sp. VB17]|nr:hypothetical protein [Shewanella sp. VB17]
MLFFLFAFYFSPIAFSGQIVVRKSSEPFDAFAVRDEVLREYEWKEALRMQQQIDILQSLPLNCIPFRSPYHYYHCNGLFYRPYLYENKELYIQVDAIDGTSTLMDKID